MLVHLYSMSVLEKVARGLQTWLDEQVSRLGSSSSKRSKSCVTSAFLFTMAARVSIRRTSPLVPHEFLRLIQDVSTRIAKDPLPSLSLDANQLRDPSCLSKLLTTTTFEVVPRPPTLTHVGCIKQKVILIRECLFHLFSSVRINS